MKHNHPPRLATALLRILLSRPDREFILGDLEEQYLQRSRQRRLRAWMWYWAQTIRSCLAASFLRKRPSRLELGRHDHAGIEDVSGSRHGRARAFLEGLFQDFRVAMRQSRAHPLHTLTIIGTLAIGIGATTIIFSVTDTVLFQKLPYEESNRLVALWLTNPRWQESDIANLNAMWDRYPFSYPEYRDLVESTTVFEYLGIYDGDRHILGTSAQPERIMVMRMTAGVFDMLGVSAALGRTLGPDADQMGADAQAVLSHETWRQRFGSDPTVIGQTVTLDGTSFTIVGVMPPGFSFPDHPPLWTNFNDSDRQQPRIDHFLRVVGRLKPGRTIADARQEMDRMSLRLAEANPEGNEYGLRVISLKEDMIGDTRKTLMLHAAAIIVVLLIVCVNIAIFVLSRANEQSRELAVRAALGAGRERLMGQFVSRTVLLCLVGGGVGLGVAWVGLKPFLTLLPPDLPRLSEITVSGRMLGYAIAASLLTGLVVGLPPALLAGRTRMISLLHEAGRGLSGGRNRLRLQESLVVGEVGLTVVLLVCAGLLARSLFLLLSVDCGFVPENVLTVSIDARNTRYTSRDQIKELYRDLFEQLETIPGIQAVAGANSMPFMGGWRRTGITLETHSGLIPETLAYSIIAGSYFPAMEIPLLSGRAFTAEDADSQHRVAIVSKSAAEIYWPGEDAVGHRLKSGGVASDSPWITVVGVAANVIHQGLDVDPDPKFYLPFGQRPSAAMTIIVKTATPPAPFIESVREILRSQAPEVPIIQISSLEDLISESIAGPRSRAFLLVSMAVLAAILAFVGISGVLAYAVSQRVREIGIRMAVGATQRKVAGQVLRRGMTLSAVGLGIGMIFSAVAVGSLEGILFQTDPVDPLTLGLVTVLVIAVAMTASYIPARRAASVDPMQILRRE